MLYKEFEISGIFNVSSTKRKFNANTVAINQDKIGHPYVVRSSVNNGIRGYIEEDDAFLNEANTFSFGQDTATIFWQPKAYFTGDKIKVLTPKHPFTEAIALYIKPCIEKAFSIFSWGGSSFNEKIIKKVAITLPIQIDDEENPIIDEEHIYHTEGYIPNWDYMQERIAELEKERVAELEQYLIAAGLNDYTLTDKELEIVGVRKEMKPFSVMRLFKPKKITRMLAKKDLSDDKIFPTYSSESTNNGIIGYTDAPEFICDEQHPVYVTFGDHTRTLNIARKSFSVLDNVKVLSPTEPYCDEVLLYIITKWRKGIKNLGYARHWKIAKLCNIQLPIQTDPAGQPIIDTNKTYHPDGFIPDWDYMAVYIRAMEKLVIKDAVDFKDEFIAKTKQAVC